MQSISLKSPGKNRWRHSLPRKEEEGSNKSHEYVFGFSLYQDFDPFLFDILRWVCEIVMVGLPSFVKKTCDF